MGVGSDFVLVCTTAHQLMDLESFVLGTENGANVDIYRSYIDQLRERYPVVTTWMKLVTDGAEQKEFIEIR